MLSGRPRDLPEGGELRAPGRRAAAVKGKASRQTHASWDGKLFLWGGCGLYTGPAFATTLHAHHALQVCIGVSGSFRLRSGATAPWRAYRGAVVLSDRPHQLDGQGSRLALLYLDPESTLARRITQLPARGGIFAVRTATVESLRSRLSGFIEAEPTACLCEELLEALVSKDNLLVPMDGRLASAIELLRGAPGRRMPIAELATAVGLSPSRLAHLFRADTGLPVRRYLLWLRLGDALQQLTHGASLTAAAHAAGFADSAHLSRTFRAMLGIAPSALG
jgi:AraC family transcriptional regulator